MNYFIIIIKNEAATFATEFGAARKNGLSIPINFKIVRDKTTLER